MNMNNRFPDAYFDDGDFDCTHATVMLFASLVAYGHYPDSTLQGVANAKFLIDGVLAAAFQNGYPNCDIVRTIMAKGPGHLDGLMEMLESACEAAGAEAFDDIFASAGME
jgi:hypothetical protein